MFLGGLADIYVKQGRYDEAESIMESVVGIRRRVFGDRDPSTLRSIAFLGTVYTEQGDYDKAGPCSRMSLSSSVASLGQSTLIHSLP